MNCTGCKHCGCTYITIYLFCREVSKLTKHPIFSKTAVKYKHKTSRRLKTIKRTTFSLNVKQSKAGAHWVRNYTPPYNCLRIGFGKYRCYAFSVECLPVKRGYSCSTKEISLFFCVFVFLRATISNITMIVKK